MTGTVCKLFTGKTIDNDLENHRQLLSMTPSRAMEKVGSDYSLQFQTFFMRNILVCCSFGKIMNNCSGSLLGGDRRRH